MWCPQCGGEFRPEIGSCPDCECPLVPERPEELIVPEPEVPSEPAMVCSLCGREYEPDVTFCLDCEEPLTRRDLPPRGEITGGRLPRDLLTRDPDREKERRRGGELTSVLRHTLGDTAGGLPAQVDPEGDYRRPDPELGEKTSLLATFRDRSDADALAAALRKGGVEGVVFEETFVDLPGDLAVDLEPYRVYVSPLELPAALDVVEAGNLGTIDRCSACGGKVEPRDEECRACGVRLS